MIHIFIINPFAGRQTFADDLRTKLKGMKNLHYFVFNTRYEGYETELVQKIQHIFQGEQLRFYCCGGSGTMRNMLNGFDDLSQAEIAFFPCGLTNDFLKLFGEDEHRFHHIEELIDGEPIMVDYIKTNHGISLNTLSTGMDSNCLERMVDYRLFRSLNEELPYSLSVLYSVFVSRPQLYEVKFDDRIPIRGRFAEIFIGNGCIFGGNMFFAESTDPTDGEAIYRLIGNYHSFKLLPKLLTLTGKKYDMIPKAMECGSCHKITFKRADGSSFNINQDGNLIRDITECKAEIVCKGLKLIVPKGVRLCH